MGAACSSVSSISGVSDYYCFSSKFRFKTISAYSSHIPLLSFNFVPSADDPLGSVSTHITSFYNVQEKLCFDGGFVVLPYSTDLVIRFKFFAPSSNSRVTLICTNDGEELHDLLHNRFKTDPNIHLLPNVFVVTGGDEEHSDGVVEGSFTSLNDGTMTISAKGEVPAVHELKNGEYALHDWSWRYLAPFNTKSGVPEDKRDGWKSVCTFLEYSATANEFVVLATFSIWLSKAPLLATASLPVNSAHSKKSHSLNRSLDLSLLRSPSKASITLSEQELQDGPLFRATLTELERKTATLKFELKVFISAIKDVVMAMKSLIVAEEAFTRLAVSFGPLKTAASYTAETHNAVFSLAQEHLTCIQTLLLEPLETLYLNNLKSISEKKKGFETASSEWYGFVSKFLALKKNNSKELRYEAQYAERQKSFEIERFDYLNFLQDLQTTRVEEILYHFSSYLEKRQKFYEKSSMAVLSVSDSLAALLDNVAVSTAVLSCAIKARAQRRAALTSEVPKSSAPAERWSAYRDLASNKGSSNAKSKRKEGFLWLWRGTDKSCKKIWCVLEAGAMQEYKHWKGEMKPKHSFSLSNCTVRESRDAERRFCFEIISPLFSRKYQATSDVEASSWISVIANVISLLLCDPKILSEPAPSQQESDIDSEISSDDSDLPQSVDLYDGAQLLKVLRLKKSNCYCADCRAKWPEWCSINLCLLLCIECGGIHRSLGSDISKIRSFLLDSASFTAELIDKFVATSNEKQNTSWEARLLPKQAISPETSKDQKSAFIINKYAKRMWLEKS